MYFDLDKHASLQFALLCASYFLFSCSFNMPIPELPAYLSSLGGGQYLGLIISLFTLTAGLSRPFSGKLADTIGRVPVMFFGASVCVVCSLLYPAFGSVTAFLLLRFFHGLSTGFYPTGSSAYAADLIPFSHRGHALGILGLCSTLGLSLGPAAGSFVSNQYGITFMFYTSSLAALISIIILFFIKEIKHNKQRLVLSHLKVSRRELFEPRVIGPALVTLLLFGSYGAALTLIPAVSLRTGLRNTGIFFTFYTIGSVAIRLFGGKALDRYSRVFLLKLAGSIMLLSMLMIAFVSVPWLLMTAAVIYGLSMGLASPATLAWTIDLADPDFRGRALSTMYIAMEAGIGLGALFSGWWYERSGRDTATTFLIMASLALLSCIYLQLFHPAKTRM